MRRCRRRLRPLLGRAGRPVGRPSSVSSVHRRDDRTGPPPDVAAIVRAAEPDWAAERAQQLPGYPVRCRARRGEGVPGVAVPGGAHRGGHLRVERLPDERVPESEGGAGIGQHPHRPGLVERGDQGGNGPAEDRGQVGDRELHSEQRRRAEHLPGRPGDESEPVCDGAGQRVWHGARREAGGARVGNRDAARPGQRGQHLGEVERVASRAVGQLQQPRVRPAAGQRADELGHGRLGERAELDATRAVDRAPQGQEVLALRYRAGEADEQQRHLPRGSREPDPQPEAGRVGPVQVVDDQGHRLDVGLVDDQGDELLGEERGDVGAAVGGDLAPQQAGDRGPPGVGRRGPDLERVEERVQRELLAEFVPGPPEDRAARRRAVVGGRVRLEPRGGGRERGADEGGLADAGLALDEQGVAAASGEISQ